MSNKPTIKNKDYLNLFVLCTNSYKSVLSSFNEHDAVVSDSQMYIKAAMLRKFITRDDNVHIGKVIKKVQKIYPHAHSEFQKIYDNYVGAYTSEEKLLLPDGTELDFRALFDDIVYGLFLHADLDRVHRINLANIDLINRQLFKFIDAVEQTIFELSELLIKLGINGRFEPQIIGASAILHPETNYEFDAHKNIKGYYSGLYGETLNLAEDEELEYLFSNKNEEEKQIMFYALSFLAMLDQNLVEGYEVAIKEIIYNPVLQDFGDFSEAVKLLGKIEEPSLISGIKFNNEHDVAYVTIVSHAYEAFVLTRKQLIMAAAIITLVIDPSNNTWRVFSIGDYPF